MRIKEKEVTLKNGSVALLKSAGPEEAEALFRHRYQTSGETYFMACEQEEMVFQSENAKKSLMDMEKDEKEFDVSAYVKGMLIGSASVRRVRNHRKYLHRAHFGISIRREYCDLGLGRKMMETALKQARKNGFEQMELGVFADNFRAVHLYESCGFKKTGVIPHAYKLEDGSYRDEIQMVCIL